jgi:hypothetical protein
MVGAPACCLLLIARVWLQYRLRLRLPRLLLLPPPLVAAMAVVATSAAAAAACCWLPEAAGCHVCGCSNQSLLLIGKQYDGRARRLGADHDEPGA